MQTFVKNQKTLIGIMGLVIMGTGNVHAIGSFDGQATLRPGISNILSGLEASHSFAKNGDVNYVTRDRTVVANNPATPPAKGGVQSAVRGVGLDVLDGWFSESPSIDPSLSAQAYLYSGVLNMAVYDGTRNVSMDNHSALISFDLDARGSKMRSAKGSTDGNLEASPVPLPAAAWSFLIGLLGVLGLKKRKHPPTETI